MWSLDQSPPRPFPQQLRLQNNMLENQSIDEHEKNHCLAISFGKKFLESLKTKELR